MMQHGVGTTEPSVRSPSRSASQGPRSPTSTRSATRRFVALNPDPLSDSSPSPPTAHPHSTSTHATHFLPDPHLHLNVLPPPNIHAPPEAQSPAPSSSVMNVDPDAPVLGMVSQADVESQRAAVAAREEQHEEGVIRRNTLGKSKGFIGGFVPWLRKDNNKKHKPPPVPVPSEHMAPSASTMAPTTDSKSANTTHSRSDRSHNAEFEPLPPITVESPSSHAASSFQSPAPFIPPTPVHANIPPSPSGTSVQHQHPPHRPPSPSVEGTTLIGHGPVMPAPPLLMAESKFTDPASLALPNSPEYRPLPHSKDYAIMAPYPPRSESVIGKALTTHPLIEKVKSIFKTIDHFPWIGEERITADYYPSRLNKEGKPWRFGNYEKRKPPQPDPTRPWSRGGSSQSEPLGSPTFGYHRSSRYDFGIRRSQFSRLRRPRSKRSGLSSWYDGRSQKSIKDLDFLSTEIDPFPPPPVPPLPPVAMSETKSGHTPVSMEPIPLFEQRIIDGQAVDVDVDQERAMMQQSMRAEQESQKHQTHHAAPNPHSHVPTGSVRSPSTSALPPLSTQNLQPRKHSRSRSRDHVQTVFSTRTPVHGFAPPSNSHNRSRSVDYYVSASQQGIPPQNFVYSGSEGRSHESSDPSRSSSLRVSSPGKPKGKSRRSRSNSAHQIHYQATIPAPVYYTTPPSIPSGYGHRRYNSQAGSSSTTRREQREYHAVPA